MSSPETATTRATLSAEARHLAAALEDGLKNGQSDLLEAQALQDLMAALCRIYSARLDAGEDQPLLRSRGSVTPTDVMATASGLLKSANLAVFELGMWQSWTGR